MLIPFRGYAPDQPALGHQGETEAQNCVPLTQKSYGPFAALATATDALDARCQGGASYRASDGTVHTFAGDATKLYKKSSGTSWENVSKAGGYTTSSDGRWYFAQYGDIILATNYADAIQAYTLNVSTDFADLSVDAPKARYIEVIRDFVVVADTFDGTDGAVQNRVWWSAAGNPTSWPTPGTSAAAAAQSDFNDVAFGGQINGIVGGVGGRDGVIFLQNAVTTMNYSGPPAVFSFVDAGRGRGTTIPGSIVNAGIFASYTAEDGHYFFDGSNSHPIGNLKVDRHFWDNVNQQFLSRICTAINPKRKLFLLAWPSTLSSGNPDKISIYNWETQWWSHASENVEFILKGYLSGYTLEELDAFGTMETLPFSLDSPAWMGGRVLAGGFGTDHKFGFFNGANKAATIETGEWPLDGGKRVFCSGVRPVTDHSSGTSQVSVGYRDTQGGSITYTTATSQGADGVCPQRVSARYMRGKWTAGSGDTWTHCQALEPTVRPEGAR
jgi:hypothetical protein